MQRSDVLVRARLRSLAGPVLIASRGNYERREFVRRRAIVALRSDEDGDPTEAAERAKRRDVMLAVRRNGENAVRYVTLTTVSVAREVGRDDDIAPVGGGGLDDRTRIAPATAQDEYARAGFAGELCAATGQGRHVNYLVPTRPVGRVARRRDALGRREGRDGAVFRPSAGETIPRGCTTSRRLRPLHGHAESP